jgi:hypothetical protein
MGSIELNVKDSDGWKGGRNETYVRDIEGRIADLDIRAIADKAIKEARPGVAERLAEGAARAVENLRRTDERRRGAAEVFGEVLADRYLVAHEADRRIGLYEPSSRTPALTVDKKAITTPHESGVVIQDAVKLAMDRGWTSLKVEGTQAFKDAVWLEAKKYDLKVGHAPSPVTRAEFDRWRETNDLRPIPQRGDPASAAKTAEPVKVANPVPDAKRDLGKEYLAKTADQRLADPLLRNAEMSARAARDLAAQRFSTEDPKLRIAIAKVDQMVSAQLSRGHQFSTPRVAQPAEHAAKQQFSRPQL